MSFYLEEDNGGLKLKEDHAYYYHSNTNLPSQICLFYTVEGGRHVGTEDSDGQGVY